MKINVESMTRKVEVDNRIPLRYYYRIADNLLKQATVYRQENNIVDLYIILLRYSSLISETIPYHRDYQAFPAEKKLYRKRLFTVLDDLETLKPEFQRLQDEINSSHQGAQLLELDAPESTSYSSQPALEWPLANRNSNFKADVERQYGVVSPQSSWKYNNDQTQFQYSTPIDQPFQKLSFSLPLPKEDTLSRHSFFPNGFQRQSPGPSAEIKVQYPSNAGLTSTENLGLNQSEQGADLGGPTSTMDSVLALNDGGWSSTSVEPSPSFISEAMEDPFRIVSHRQPLPPPVLAQVQHETAQIHPSKVADPRPGAAMSSQNGTQSSSEYQHLHVPVSMLSDFLRLAKANTQKNLETCGVLAGSLKNRVFHITTLIIPKQESTSDSCQTLNEEEMFEVQDRLSLFPLGWIHTHPTQTCFMSSVDLHTHYSYQIMLPEAVAIVMAPTDTSCPHGIFHLSDPAGVSVIRNCQERGFHPHEEPADGSPIYKHCSHVYMNPKLKFDVVDLRLI